MAIILPTGQWYAPSAVINDALIMPEYARACQSMPEYARVCQSMSEYARVCLSMPKYARVCQSMPEYARVCQSTQEYARVCKSMPDYARLCQSMPEYLPLDEKRPEKFGLMSEVASMYLRRNREKLLNACQKLVQPRSFQQKGYDFFNCQQLILKSRFHRSL